MSINKLALIRYKAIDECLRNRLRKWTLDDLIEKVSDVLYDAEGIDSGVSRRTIQSDIQLMRSDKLGYNAPIIVVDKKYYAYEDPEYSIATAPVSDADIDKMKEILGLLKQMNGFQFFEEMSQLVLRLENNLYTTTHTQTSLIQFESNQRLKGLEHLNSLYQAILHQKPVLLIYQSFKATSPREQIYYPYLLKEYRNRWFLIVKAKGGKFLLTLALDRIISFTIAESEKFVAYGGIDFERYYADTIGVTKNETDRGHRVILQFCPKDAPYVLTKPLHASQTILKQDAQGLIIRIDVVLNFELEREILGFGEKVKVLAPRILESRIRKRLSTAAERYTTPSSNS
jgi:predicted DNA-binding transcriptional regulator YafY